MTPPPKCAGRGGGDSHLGEHISDLRQVGFVVPAEGRQVLDGLLPDVNLLVLAQVQ
jgi:hypothetical protein